jgi:hypothetical protein
MLFGADIGPGRSPGDILPMDVEQRRVFATVLMTNMGYNPA